MTWIELILWVLLAMIPVGEPTVGQATYYHPSLIGGIMRDGTPYESSNPFIAAVGGDSQGQPSIPLGTWLLVRSDDGIYLLIQVRDTGRFPKGDIDLSSSGFERLAPLSRGRIGITWQKLGIP